MAAPVNVSTEDASAWTDERNWGMFRKRCARCSLVEASLRASADASPINAAQLRTGRLLRGG